MREGVRPTLSGFCLALMVAAVATGSVAAEFQTGVYSIEPFPSQPTTKGVIKLLTPLRSPGCVGIDPNGVRIDYAKRTIDVSVYISYLDFLGPCPVMPMPSEVTLGVLPDAGYYKVSMFEEDWGLPHKPLFRAENYIGQFYLLVSPASPIASPETPAAGSVQSGVGMVRGWACDADRVEVQFDGLPLIAVAYGTSRADTNFTCGDDDNGYGMVFNWGLLGHGVHTLTTFIDGARVSTVSFEVTGLDEPFVKGLKGAYELREFPVPGEAVTVEWSEPDQNFIITEYDR